MALDFRKPGVYIEEAPFNTVNTAVGSADAVGMFVGATSKGPINVPTPITSWTDFQTIFGGFTNVQGLSALVPANRIFIRSSSTDLDTISSPFKGDLAFLHPYRHDASTFYKADESDIGSTPSYHLPHNIWIYDGFTWIDTHYEYHAESKLFDGWDSLNVQVQILMITAEEADSFAAPSGTYNYGDIILRFDLDSQRMRFYVFGSKSSSDASQAVFKTSSTQGDFVGFTTTSGSNVYGLTAGWVEIVSDVFNHATTGIDAVLKAVTNNTYDYWGVLRFADEVEGTNPDVSDPGYVDYVYLQDPPGAYTIGPASTWNTWFPTVTGSGLQSAVTALSYLPYAVYSFFQNGGRNAYVVRSVGQNAGDRATVNYMDSTPTLAFTVQALGAGSWANGISGGLSVMVTNTDTAGSTQIFSFRVFLDGVEIERFINLTMDGSIPGTKRADVVLDDPVAGSKYVTLTSYSPLITPTFDSNNGTPRNLGSTTVGTDPDLPSSPDLTASAVATASQIIGPILLNIVPYSLDVTDPTNLVTSVIAASEFDRGDIFVIADGAPRSLPGEPSETYRSSVTSVYSGITNDSRVAAYTPWISVPDPATTGSTILVPPGGAVMGVYARMDATEGVFRAPAGIIASITNGIDVDLRFTDNQLGTLNEDGVNVIRPMVGSGVCVMGARTRKSYGADRYVNARRTLIFLTEVLQNSTQFAVFENNDSTLWNNLAVTADAILRPFWQAGGLAGGTVADAYFIKCDAEVNTPSVVQSGQVNMSIGVALQAPAEFVVITLSQFSGQSFTAVSQ